MLQQTQGWTADKSWFDSRQGQASIPAVRPTQRPKGSFTRTKAAATLPNSTQVKNGAISPLPHAPS